MNASWPLLLNVIVVLVNTGLFLALPSLSRRDVLFAVTVPAAFRQTEEGRTATRTYRLWVLAAAGAALLAIFIGRPSIPLAVLAELVIVWVAWSRAHATVRPYAVEPPRTRLATASRRQALVAGQNILLALPFCIMGASAFLLNSNWDRIPNRFATHWGTMGAPDRWTTKSLGSVYGPLAMGAVMLAICTVVTSALASRTRQIATDGTAWQAEQGFKRGSFLTSLASCYFMAVLFSFFALRPLVASGDELGRAPWWLFGAILVFTVATTVWMYRVGQGGQRMVTPAEHAAVPGDGTPDNAWKLGLVYYNPADPALLVEKRMGFGWTLNYGNKLSWWLTGAALSPLLWIAWQRMTR
jgi:uncharacterized membrane protein